LRLSVLRGFGPLGPSKFNKEELAMLASPKL